MTGDWLSKVLFSLLKSNSDALLFKSIKDCTIPNESNLTVFGIANSVFLESLNHDAKVAKFLRCLCFCGIKVVLSVIKITSKETYVSYLIPMAFKG